MISWNGLAYDSALGPKNLLEKGAAIPQKYVFSVLRASYCEHKTIWNGLAEEEYACIKICWLSSPGV